MYYEYYKSQVSILHTESHYIKQGYLELSSKR